MNTEATRKADIVFVGGDARMLSAADFIAAKGYRCAAYLPARGECGVRSIGSAAEAEGCRAVVLPLPCTARDGSLFAAERYGRTDIGEIIARFGKGVLFIGGRLPFAGEGFADYFLSEALVAANAAATAEAAITLGMQCSGRTVCGTRYAVLGYGRIARRLTALIRAAGGEVTVFARRGGARAEAAGCGARAERFEAFAAAAGGFDIIFNTVPEQVLPASAFALIRKSCVPIELASAPGGFPADIPRAPVDGGALPGRIVPVSAGELIGAAVAEILEERGILP